MTEDGGAVLATRAREAGRMPGSDPRGAAEGHWASEVRCHDSALEELAPEWDDLVARCRTATPFQYAAWLTAWWRAYGSAGRLRLVLVRRDGRLVAGAAMAVWHRPYPVLVPIGSGVSDFTDVLLDDTCVDRAAAELAAALPAHRPWIVADLREVRPEGAAQHVVAHWPGWRSRLPDSVCQHLPALPMEDLLHRLPGRTAQRSRVKQRKIAAAGVEVRETPAAEVPDAITAMLQLHALQWRGRGATPEHLNQRFAQHLREAAAGLVAGGRACVQEYRLEGELVAVNVLLLSPGLAGLYMYGAHPSLRKRLDIAGLLFGESLIRTRHDGVPLLSLLRGTEPYKQRWRPDRDQNQRLVLGGGRLAPAAVLHVGAVRLRAAAVRTARARLPWLITARTRVRELRGVARSGKAATGWEPAGRPGSGQ